MRDDRERLGGERAAKSWGSSRLELREEQASFQAGGHYTTGLPDVDATLIRHIEAMVARLIILITAAVRASDDERTRVIDNMLRQAETLLAQARIGGI